MPRRLLGAALVAASLLAGPGGAFAETEFPRADCDRRVNDSSGDAVPTYATSGSTNVQVPNAASEPGVDILHVTMRVTAAKVQAYLGLKEYPTTFGATESGYGYDVTFSRGKKNFLFQYFVGNDAHAAIRDTATYPNAKWGDNVAPATAVPGVTVETEKTKGFIVLAVPRGEMEKVLGAALVDGDTFTGLAARTWAQTGNQAATKFTTDTAVGTAEQATVTVGDEYCIGGPPTHLVDYAAAPVQYGDTGELTVSLANENDEAVGGKEIAFSVAGGPAVTATTDEEGVAVVTFTAPSAGTLPVTMSWAGDEEAGKSSLAATVEVAAETTRFAALAVAKPTKTARTVTATLLDDDAHPVAAVGVDWYVNGKKAATVPADAAGRSVFKAAKPGQSVQAKLAAVSGRYAGAASNTAKV
jgi:hypothetical protein